MWLWLWAWSKCLNIFFHGVLFFCFFLPLFFPWRCLFSGSFYKFPASVLWRWKKNGKPLDISCWRPPSRSWIPVLTVAGLPWLEMWLFSQQSSVGCFNPNSEIYVLEKIACFEQIYEKKKWEKKTRSMTPLWGSKNDFLGVRRVKNTWRGKYFKVEKWVQFWSSIPGGEEE